MAEAVLDKEKCGNCGVDVREDTSFCYNCGTRVAVDETDTALEEALEAANNGHLPEESNKLAAAATERKRARVTHRKVTEYAWEPTAGEGARMTLIIAILIAAFALVVVLLMLDW